MSYRARLQRGNIEMNNAEDLKPAVVDVLTTTDSYTTQEITSQGDNYALLSAKEEPGIEDHIDGKKACNSMVLIKQEFHQNDHSCSLLTIKQEELNIKHENLEPSCTSSECSGSKRDFKLKTDSSNKAQENSFSCTYCHYSCTKKRYLNRHLVTHTAEKTISCMFCDYKCIRKRYLKSHIAIHTRLKKFSCTFCDYKCCRKGDLKSHLTQHTGEKRFTCAHCDYKCSLKMHLKSHLEKHRADKPFSCTLCDYKCCRKSNLTSHLAQHTGKKPFSCNFCDYKCIQKNHLKSHVAKHTGVKPFSCTICEYKCTQKCHLIRHMKSHADTNTKVEEFVPNTSQLVVVKNNEMIKKENDHGLPKTWKLDLEHDPFYLQISSKQLVTIKQEEVDIKKESL